MKIHSSIIRKSWANFLTVLASWYVRLFYEFPPKEILRLEQVKSILIIRLDKVGDLVLATPVFKNLKMSIPGVKISVLVKGYAAGVLKNNPFVDEILIYDNKEDRKKAQNRGFDLALNLIYDFHLKSALACFFSGATHRVGYKDKYSKYFYNIEAKKDPAFKYELQRNLDILRELKIEIKSEETGLFPVRDEIKESADFIGSIRTGEKDMIVGLNPGTGRRRREWPLEKFIELGKSLKADRNIKILVLWGQKDKLSAQKIVAGIGEGAFMAPKTDITLLAALLTFCKVFVCGNTGPAHIAMAMKVPLVGLYGKTDHLNWTPEKNDKIAVISGYKCSSIRVAEVIKGVEKFL